MKSRSCQAEYDYLRLLRDILTRGTRQKNRTGVDTFFLPGAMLQFDLREGYPLLTTKKMAFKQIVGELCGFIRGFTSAALFRDLGCKIWDANANENKIWLANRNRKGIDDLGRIYGAQWRTWNTAFVGDGDPPWDQLASAIQLIYDDPTSRRIIVSAWRPDELNLMALPPCHLLFQILIGQEDDSMNMCMYMRSCDMFLGVPFNIASYAALLQLLAELTGYTPGMLTMFLADVHIYENHIQQVEQQLLRKPKALPHLVITGPKKGVLMPAEAVEELDSIFPGYFTVVDYDPHPLLVAVMAV